MMPTTAVAYDKAAHLQLASGAVAADARMHTNRRAERRQLEPGAATSAGSVVYYVGAARVYY